MAELRKWIPNFRHLFSGNKFELDGSSLQLATARRQIPIFLAASQPRMLEISGEFCDGTILMGAADPDFCRWQLEYIYAGLRKANKERKEFTIDLVITASIDDDIEQALSDVAGLGYQARLLNSRAGKNYPKSGENTVMNLSLPGKNMNSRITCHYAHNIKT